MTAPPIACGFCGGSATGSSLKLITSEGQAAPAICANCILASAGALAEVGVDTSEAAQAYALETVRRLAGRVKP